MSVDYATESIELWERQEREAEDKRKARLSEAQDIFDYGDPSILLSEIPGLTDAQRRGIRSAWIARMMNTDDELEG